MLGPVLLLQALPSSMKLLRKPWYHIASAMETCGITSPQPWRHVHAVPFLSFFQLLNVSPGSLALWPLLLALMLHCLFAVPAAGLGLGAGFPRLSTEFHRNSGNWQTVRAGGKGRESKLLLNVKKEV